MDIRKELDTAFKMGIEVGFERALKIGKKTMEGE